MYTKLILRTVGLVIALLLLLGWLGALVVAQSLVQELHPTIDPQASVNQPTQDTLTVRDFTDSRTLKVMEY